MTRRIVHAATGAKFTTREEHPFRGQARHVLELLLERRHSASPWVASSELARISLQYNGRIFTLREAGYHIESRVEIQDGKKCGSYRLTATPEEAKRPQPGLPFEVRA